MATEPSTSLRLEDLDQTSVPLAALFDHYIAACRSEGKTAKTIKGYREKLGRYVRWASGYLIDFSIEKVRLFVVHLQSRQRWDGHPYTPATQELLSASTV